MGLDAGSEVVGRASEQVALAAFVQALADGPSAVVLDGEAGMGKTTLWRFAVETARTRGHTVLVSRPSAAEAQLGFAGLRDLFEDVVPCVLDAVPAPQADALRIALLLERPEGIELDQAIVAASCLSALRALSAEHPVLVAIDDVQWLDVPTATVVGFLWRRIRGDAVGVLLAHRTGEPVPAALAGAEGVWRLPVGALDIAATRELLQRRLGLILPMPTLRPLHAAAGGNPFFALELAPGFDRHRAEVAAGAPAPVPERLLDLVAERIAVLPAATRAALAVTSALARPTPELVSLAVGDPGALQPAFAADVLDADGGRLRFSHPLLAAAAFDRLDPIARRAVHERLAAVTPDAAEAAHHLALATTEPDAAVADALQRAADDVFRRGASAVAAELYEHAHRLTPTSARVDRHRRARRAARHHWTAGDIGRGRSLLEAAVADAPSSAARAEALTRLGWVCAAEGDQPRAAEHARAALAEPGVTLSTRAEAENCLASALMFMGEALEEAARSAARCATFGARSSDLLRHNDGLCQQALIGTLRGDPRSGAYLQAAADQGEAAAGFRVHGWPMSHRAVMGLSTDRHDDAAVAFRRLTDQALERGDEASVGEMLAYLAVAEYLAGRWQQAVRAAADAIAATGQVGQRPYQAISLAARAGVEAATGDESGARNDANAALDLIGERGMVMARIHAVAALALLDLMAGRMAEAADRLRALRERLVAAGVGEPGALRFVSDEVEALVALGRQAPATELVDWLKERGRALDRASALAAAARGLGLLAATGGDHQAAISAFGRAADEYARANMPFERARTLLHLGAAQRRAQRRRAARETLATALGMFHGLGAMPWCDQAAAELARIGGRRPAGAGLTPTESRIVALVVEGRTNKEVAEALYLSPKTVESNLRNVFRKLGVRSRTALTRQVLTGEQSAGISSLPVVRPPP